VLLLLSFCSLVGQLGLYAKIEIKNDTPYELKAAVTYGAWGILNNPYASINDGCVSLLSSARVHEENLEGVMQSYIPTDDPNSYKIEDSVQGFLPGKVGWTKKDKSYVKQKWLVWAKIDGKWKLIINTSNHATGGLIKAVTATITSKKDSNGETFDIKIKHGW